MTNTPNPIFDRSLLKQRRNRAARHIDDYGFLVEEVVARLIDRLGDLPISGASVLDLGCHTGQITDSLLAHMQPKTLVQCDLALEMVRQSQGLRLVVDEEALPFAAGSFDTILSAMNLHWVNDLPGTLIQLRNMLSAKGLFLANLFGGRSLHELRQVMAEVEQKHRGGISPRVAPFVDIKELGALLQRAGFHEPVVDSENITITYEHPHRLLEDLHHMGESNMLVARSRKWMTKAIWQDIDATYRDMFANDQGQVTATFELVTVTAWA